MKTSPLLLSLMVSVVAACASTSAPPPAAPSQSPTAAAAAPPAASVAPGSIGVTCKAKVNGYHDYTTSVTAPNLDVCSVGGDGMLTLYVKGQGNDTVRLHLAGYHGAGTYPLSGGSYFSLTDSIPGAGAAQSSQNCAAASCSAVVTDASAGAGAGQRSLEFAVTCPQLCDVDTHICTATPGGGATATWSFRAGCRVP